MFSVLRPSDGTRLPRKSRMFVNCRPPGSAINYPMLLRATLAFALCFIPARAAIIAGPFVNPDNQHTYFLLTPTSWTKAQQQARSLGGNLVTINDVLECVWIVENFVYFGGAPTPMWIGLTDKDSEGSFRWISGETSGFRNWHAGEPNNDAGLGTPENYAFIFPGQRFRGNWRDANDSAISDLETDPGRWTTGPDGDIGCFALVEINALPIPLTVSANQTSNELAMTFATSPGATYRLFKAASPASFWWADGEPIRAESTSLAIRRPLADPAAIYRVLQFHE